MSNEIKPEIIEKTQKILGKHISKPPLTEKLLKKPPFRFLHDIVTSVIKDTGFLKGVFSETELLSDNVKERNAKIAFLTKLIEAVKTLTEIELNVKPSKIIAGLEPIETNKLLQALGTALDKKIDSAEYVQGSNSKPKVSDKIKKSSKTSTKDEKKKDSSRLKKHEVEEKPEKSKKKERSSRESNNVDIKMQEKVNKKSKKDIENKEVKVDRDCPKIKEEQNVETLENISSSQLSENKNEDNIVHQNLDKKEEIQVDNKKENIEQDVSVDSKPPENTQRKVKNDRPKSARPQSGDSKKSISNKVLKLEENNTMLQKKHTTVRPMSSLRPPTVRPSSARPGAPRLRPDSALPIDEIVPLGKINVIVENYNVKETDEEETVVIQSADIESEPVQQILDIPEDKGHLVEQILEQIHDNDIVEHVKIKNEVDWEGEGFRNRDATNREISQLRSQIQSLTKVANPLGKLMNYLHEDVESMISELSMWTNMKRDMYIETNKQKKINEECNKPLKLQLQELEENIRKQEAEIVNIRSNILRNELRIKDLLVK